MNAAARCRAARLEKRVHRFSVFMDPARSRGGCPTYSVCDTRHGEIVFGPTTDWQMAARRCDFLSRPGDAAAAIDWAVDVARQMALVGMEA
jgi:hypothetical protein